MPGFYKRKYIEKTYLINAKSKSGLATKQEIANDKLLSACPTKAYMGHRMQVGISCHNCVHFETCPKAGKQDYCLYRPGRFISKDLAQ